MSAVKWCRRSTRQIAETLSKLQVKISHSSVWRRLKEAGFSLRANRKRLTFRESPDRNRQFKHIEVQKRDFLKAGDPVISVDTKKRELIGPFKNAGRAWVSAPQDVSTYDFPTDAKGVAIPYGIYDVGTGDGYVVVGTSRNTAAFAVNSIKQWWLDHGRRVYSRAKRILILADAGGSNGARVGSWKRELEWLATRLKIEIVVAHYPTGGSKWNPVEHRLFGPISVNWAAQPLVDYRTACRYIRGAKLSRGGRCRVRLDRRRWLTAKEKAAARKAAAAKGESAKKAARETPMPPGSFRASRTLPAWNYAIVPACRRRRISIY